MSNFYKERCKTLAVFECTKRELISIDRSLNYLKAWEEWDNHSSISIDVCEFARTVIGRSDCDLATQVELATRFEVFDEVVYSLVLSTAEDLVTIPPESFLSFAMGYIEHYVPEVDDQCFIYFANSPVLNKEQKKSLVKLRKSTFVKMRLREHDTLVDDQQDVPISPSGDEEEIREWFTGEH